MKDGPKLANNYVQVWSNTVIFNRSFILGVKLLHVENHTLSSEISHTSVLFCFIQFLNGYEHLFQLS